MRLLVLGGTQFYGRHLVEQALARSHDVTLFNRGRTAPDLFPEAEHLVGDRDGRLEPLQAGEWDAAIDVAGFVPRVVRASAELLASRVGHYTFVSTIGVYADRSGTLSEDDGLAELDPTHSADELREDYENYGPLKALCEGVAREVFGGRALIVRPGLIVGPHDPTGRFTYWADRLRRGGEILAPAPPERRVQFVDVRDLAAFTLDLVERRDSSVYNVTREGVPWGELLAGGNVTWVSDEFLVEQGVEEWMELPLWLASPEFFGMHRADVSRAVAAGLRFRPVAETVAGAAGAPAKEGVGLSPEREAELLAAWHAR